MQNNDFMDVHNLPDAPDFMAYEKRPIQNFGMDLLKKMGIGEQNGIGKRRQNRLPQPLVLKQRPKGLGLGAEQQKKEDEIQIVNGDYVRITQEPHLNLDGIILDIMQDECFIELVRSKAKIKISKKSLKKITKKQFQENQGEDIEPADVKKRRLKWVVPQIRVKVIDKNSKQYLKKLMVSEILSEREFQCREDGGRVVVNLSEKQLQTVLPKAGGIVLILKGKYLGQKAKVMQRNKKKQEVMVQTLDELQVLNLCEDDISQFIDL